MIDLRSDTVTKPSNAMRSIMASAEVGDDVYREDPSVKALEEYSAHLAGKEAALFVSSGTMGNLISTYLQAPRGSEVLMHELAHTFFLEQSGISAIVGAKPVPITSPRGILQADAIEAKINQGGAYYSEQTSLIIIENSHNFCGGTIWQHNDFEQLSIVAKAHKLPIHMDGARAFNASIATGMTLKEMASYCSTITFCLSKGLGAPIGAMICGDHNLIKEALRLRKMLGGGMRQVGIAAAAGLYALQNNITSLADDHLRARCLSEAFSNCRWATAEGESETNILFATTLKPAQEAVDRLTQKGILCFAMGPHRLRMVTHLDINDEDTELACKVIRELY